MNDVREIVLYFGDGSKLVPVDIAKGLTDRYPELGNPLVLAPEGNNPHTPIVVFKENNEFMITVTLMTVNVVINHTYFDKMDTIIFDLVDMFDEENVSLSRMGIVYSLFYNSNKKDLLLDKVFNSNIIPDDMEDFRVSFFKKIKSKIGTINCWERIITDKERMSDLLYQFDFNTNYDKNADFNMKFIKEIISIADEYIDSRVVI